MVVDDVRRLLDARALLECNNHVHGEEVHRGFHVGDACQLTGVAVCVSVPGAEVETRGYDRTHLR